MRMPLVSLIMLGFLGLDNPTVLGKPGVRLEGDHIVMETDHVLYMVSTDGTNKAFMDRKTRNNYLLTGPTSRHFMSIQQHEIRDGTSRQGPPLEGKWTGSTAVKWQNGFLWITFGDTEVQAKVHVRSFPNYLTLELISINDHSISSILLARLPLNLTKHIGTWQCRNNTYGQHWSP